jgi:hypothetical protein
MRLFILIGVSLLPQPAIPANLIEGHDRSGTPDGLHHGGSK